MISEKIQNEKGSDHVHIRPLRSIILVYGNFHVFTLVYSCDFLRNIPEWYFLDDSQFEPFDFLGLLNLIQGGKPNQHCDIQ